jgi:hypothetical protein
MSSTLYGYSQSNDSDTVSLVLEDGTLFTVIDIYSKAQSKATIVRGCPFFYPHICSYPPQALIVASCISLVATVGLLAAIAVRSNSILYCVFLDLTFCKMSAFNTRAIKNPNMFVRTHVAFYFVSLLLSDILQCES